MNSPLIYHLTELEKIISNSEADIQDQAEASELFRKIWTKAPPEWKKSHSASSQPRDRIKLDRWKTDPITVPENLFDKLKLWVRDPSSFFITDATTSLSNNPFTQLYSFLHNVSGGDKHIQSVRLRLGRIGLSRVKERLRSRLRTDSKDEEEFENRIEIDGIDRDEVGKNAKSWAKQGEKLDALSKALGGLGSMICMPTDISDYKLLQIPLEGSLRTGALENLKSRGINNVNKEDIKLCYDVGVRINNWMETNADSYFLEFDPRPKKRSKTQNPKAKRKTMSPAGADHLTPRASPILGLNIDSAGNLPNQPAWVGVESLPGGNIMSQVPAADLSTTSNNLQISREAGITETAGTDLDLEHLENCDQYFDLQVLANFDLEPYSLS